LIQSVSSRARGASDRHLIDIEKISRKLEKTEGVKTVRSATRPAGNGLNQFFDLRL
jgi:RND superfamily putative drug exporter